MRKKIYKTICILLSSTILFSFSGCGKTEIEDVVYVDETDSNLSETEASEENTDFDPYNPEKTLVYSNTLNVRGTNISIEIEDSDYKPDQLPSYKAKRTVYDENKEKTLVHSLLGDTAKSIDVDITDYLKRDDALENHSDNDIVHVYEGSYNGIESRLTYIYTAYDHRLTIEMHPLDAGSFIGEPENKFLSYYYRDVMCSLVMPESETRLGQYNDLETNDESSGYNDPETADGSEEMYISSEDIAEINTKLKDLPNRTELSFDGLYDTAYDFTKNTLGYNLADESALSVYTYGQFFPFDLTYYYPYVEKTEILNNDFIAQDDSCVTELVFSDKQNLNSPEAHTDNLIKDGYQVSITSRIAGILPVINKDDAWNNSSHGWINITDKGILGFDFSYCFELEEILSENVQLLDFNVLMECFEKELTDHLNTVDIGLSNIRFEYIHFVYYGIESPDDSNELTFIPAWVISGYNNGMPCLDVIINAVDGSIISIE